MKRLPPFDPNLEARFKRWQPMSACIGKGHLFHPGPYENQVAAKALCRECPVRNACLDYALTKPEPYGIWGGLNERERKRLRRQAS